MPTWLLQADAEELCLYRSWLSAFGPVSRSQAYLPCAHGCQQDPAGIHLQHVPISCMAQLPLVDISSSFAPRFGPRGTAPTAPELQRVGGFEQSFTSPYLSCYFASSLLALAVAPGFSRSVFEAQERGRLWKWVSLLTTEQG